MNDDKKQVWVTYNRIWQKIDNFKYLVNMSVFTASKVLIVSNLVIRDYIVLKITFDLSLIIVLK